MRSREDENVRQRKGNETIKRNTQLYAYQLSVKTTCTVVLLSTVGHNFQPDSSFPLKLKAFENTK